MENGDLGSSSSSEESVSTTAATNNGSSEGKEEVSNEKPKDDMVPIESTSLQESRSDSSSGSYTFAQTPLEKSNESISHNQEKPAACDHIKQKVRPFQISKYFEELMESGVSHFNCKV
jgi:hypothetical protein